ncbi:MAG TPA: beta-galactosidase, partial [Nitrospiraceae bacterium]|nr:beta-galactosidase [Nitrospiraceae bacterium]
MYFGVCYYPELWPEAQWPEDVALMREAGLNVVRLAEFAWARLEAADGRYDFSWLDRIVALLSQADIAVVLGTPTVAPPPWLA